MTASVPANHGLWRRNEVSTTCVPGAYVALVTVATHQLFETAAFTTLRGIVHRRSAPAASALPGAGRPVPGKACEQRQNLRDRVPQDRNHVACSSAPGARLQDVRWRRPASPGPWPGRDDASAARPP